MHATNEFTETLKYLFIQHSGIRGYNTRNKQLKRKQYFKKFKNILKENILQGYEKYKYCIDKLTHTMLLISTVSTVLVSPNIYLLSQIAVTLWESGIGISGLVWGPFRVCFWGTFVCCCWLMIGCLWK